MRRRKSKPVPQESRWKPCGSCSSGFRVAHRNGLTFAVRCRCWKNWKHGVQTFHGTDNKAKAAGE